MSVIGKKNSTLVKQQVKESKLLTQGVKLIKFWHEAAAEELSIPFGSLNLPADISSAGLSNPTPSEILAANLSFFKENVKVFSSLNGELMIGLTFTVNLNGIKFLNGYTATPGEIFEVTYKNSVISGNLIVDSRPISASGVLTAGNTEFSVGDSFRINAFPGSQIGEVLVFVDGVLQFRNVNNATAAPAADGNYQEVPNSGGFGTIIKFNEAFGYDVNIIVTSRGQLAERPNVSMMQNIDTIAGQVDKIVEVLADVADVPESTFQTAPNNVDLKVFGDKVISLLGAQVPITTPWTAVAPIQLRGSTTDPTYGTVVENKLTWRRNQENMEVIWNFKQSSAGAAGSGDYYLEIPDSEQFRAALFGATGGASQNMVGKITVFLSSIGKHHYGYGFIEAANPTRVRFYFGDDASPITGWGSSKATFAAEANMQVSIRLSIPIEGWNATQTLAEQLGI